jgi:hypothetical protein
VQAAAALIDPKILSGDKPLPFQLGEQGDVMRRAARTEVQAAQAIGPALLLRAHGERPSDYCVAEKSEKLAPFH